VLPCAAGKLEQGEKVLKRIRGVDGEGTCCVSQAATAATAAVFRSASSPSIEVDHLLGGPGCRLLCSVATS
jgi:hypothetical protein